MEIDHFSHEHPLTLIQSEKKIRRKYRNNIRCKGCEKSCNFPLYGCPECSFYLDKSCAELPEEFKNPFHPHPLTLVFDTDISFACQACFKGCNGIHFRCEVCDFDLDIDCALLRPPVEEGFKQLQHFTHLHPLALVEKKDIEVTCRVKCLVCGEHCSGPCYGCDPCGVFLHQPCAEFEYPPEIQHYIHPCPLALHSQVHSFRCRACDTCMLGICYRCELCTFYIDVECALLSSIESEDQAQIKHFSHRHPLFVEEINDGDQIYCFACGTDCSGPTYVCSQREFSLHESCASVSPKIYDLLHPQHPLTLVVKRAEESTTQEGLRCNVCCDDCNDLTYRCGPCNFNLHEHCARQLPTIKYEGHRHLLLYVEKIGLEAKCNACDNHCDSSLLRCSLCNFNLHLRCSPLPPTIKHNCHIDSLILKESPAEDELDEEFYCNACEEEREPRYPIYYCAECPFVAEVSCVISEVTRWLKGEYGDVDLRMPGGKFSGKVISERLEIKKICKTEAAQAIPIWSEPEVEKVEVKDHLPFLDHLLNFFSEICQKEEAQAIRIRGDVGVQEAEVMSAITSGHRSKPFSEDEQMELKHILLDKEMETSSAGGRLFDEQDNLDISLVWDKEYTELKQKLDSSPAEDYMEFWEEKEEFVNVGDYLVPESLAPILESLFAKYGDVSVDDISPRVKMFLFVILCRSIDSMCKTRVLDISECQLINWWKYLKAMQSAGFKIQFALDHLDRVVHAYIGLQLTERVTKNLVNLDEEISKKSEEVEKLEKNLKVLKVRRKHISEESGKKSRLIEECLTEATKLKWRKAGEGLQLNKLV